MNTCLRKLSRSAALALSLLSGIFAAQAADAPRVGVRGAITAIAGDSLMVHTNQGQDMLINLTADTQVRGVTLAQVADIKPGSYVGSAALPQADGTFKALEVHVFPPEMAGTGEGHRAFDLTSGSTMTNGSVGDLVTTNGRTMTVKYNGGEKKIVIPDDVPVVNLVPGDRSLLKPGVKVVMFAQPGPDGSLTAGFISAGKDGVTPPM